MAKQGFKPAGKSIASTALVEPLIDPDLYTQIAFILTLALIIARAMMTESLRDSVDAVFKGSNVPRTISAGGILFLDALCIVPAILVLLRRMMDPTYVIRWTWSHVLIGLLATWSLCSIGWSTDKFLTLDSAASTMASASLIWSSAQLVRSWLRLRILAGVCFGLMLFYAEQGLEYRFLSVPENVKFFNEHRDEILREHDFDPDSFAAKQFEHKVTSGEMIGFNTSPNAFAAVIVMLLAITAGVAIQRGAETGKPLWWIGIAAVSSPILLVLKFTGAKTAMGTIALAAAALVIIAFSAVRQWLALRPKRAFWLAFSLFWLGIAAVAGHGIAHGSLPQDSLNFRWRYWAASAQMVRQHPLLGVGWGNFGEPYLGARWPIAAEEIRDPHNFLVRAFAELGVIGGLLAIAWLARAAWEITHPVVPETTAAGKRRVLIFALAGVFLGTLLNMAFSLDFNQPSAYLLLEIFRRVLALGLLTIGVLVASVRVGGDDALDTRPAPWLLYGLLIGLGTFFVHNLMEFVFAEPGPLTLFSVLLGAAIGLRTRWPAPAFDRSRGPVIGVLAAGAIAWLAVVGMLVIPISDAEEHARDGDDQIRAGRPDLAVGLLTDAFRIVPYNFEYAYRAARAMHMAGESPERVEAELELAIAADPRNVQSYLMHASEELRRPQPDLHIVRADYQHALDIDPENMLARLDYAERLAKLGLREEAASQYERSLQTNAAYHPDEPKRLTPERVKQIEQLIAQLRSPDNATTKPAAP